MDEASPEEKLAIATKFLLSSPPGEFDVVLRDVKSVMGGSAELLGGRAEGVFRAYVYFHYHNFFFFFPDIRMSKLSSSSHHHHHHHIIIISSSRISDFATRVVFFFF
jgi:hypothetical protein